MHPRSTRSERRMPASSGACGTKIDLVIGCCRAKTQLPPLFTGQSPAFHRDCSSPADPPGCAPTGHPAANAVDRTVRESVSRPSRRFELSVCLMYQDGNRPALANGKVCPQCLGPLFARTLDGQPAEKVIRHIRTVQHAIDGPGQQQGDGHGQHDRRPRARSLGQSGAQPPMLDSRTSPAGASSLAADPERPEQQRSQPAHHGRCQRGTGQQRDGQAQADHRSAVAKLAELGEEHHAQAREWWSVHWRPVRRQRVSKPAATAASLSAPACSSSL